MTSIKTILKNILEWIIGTDRYYSASWTASSSSATSVQLTDKLILPKGTYLIAVGTPYVQTSAVTIGLRVGASTDLTTLTTCPVNAYTKASFIIQLTADSTQIYVNSQSSASVTYTQPTRGSLKAVRLCG